MTVVVPRRMAFLVRYAALAPWAQGPEQGGTAGQIQADVPEGVYGSGDSAESKQREQRL